MPREHKHKDEPDKEVEIAPSLKISEHEFEDFVEHLDVVEKAEHKEHKHDDER